MFVELGHFALILALLMSAAQAFFGLAGSHWHKPAWLAVVPSAVAGQFVFLLLAVGSLVYAFVGNDFSVLYVASNSNSALPTFFRVAALWGPIRAPALGPSRVARRSRLCFESQRVRSSSLCSPWCWR